jgi:hypothetical protein
MPTMAKKPKAPPEPAIATAPMTEHDWHSGYLAGFSGQPQDASKPDMWQRGWRWGNIERQKT